MITGNERLIVVLGMAHSGTTILTYVLKRHPDVMIAAEGTEAWIFENTWLPAEQGGPIQDLLTRRPTKRLLLKRPWCEVWNGEWMAREMPGARFVYCHRDFDEIAKSWSKPESLVDDALRNGGVDYQRDYYRTCWDKAEAFGRSVPFFRRFNHADFAARPGPVMADLAAWLGLAPFAFDVSKVGNGNDIKAIIRRYGYR